MIGIAQGDRYPQTTACFQLVGSWEKGNPDFGSFSNFQEALIRFPKSPRWQRILIDRSFFPRGRVKRSP
jgi:hypothetical protein